MAVWTCETELACPPGLAPQYPIFKGDGKAANPRAIKAKKIAPRPVGLIRPVVRGSSVKYNTKLRIGRGFSLDELQAAGFTKKQALTIGVSIDWRRRNRSQEDFDRNVKRLQEYKSKLVIFPRKPNSKRVKSGDSSAEQLAKATQVLSKVVLPFSKSTPVPASRKITEAELAENVWGKQRSERTTARLWAIREKRIKEKADAGAAKAKKDKKKAAKGADDE